MRLDRGMCPVGYRFLCLQQKDYALKFLRDVMCDQNLGPKDVAVVTLCDHSHHIGTLAIPFLVARAALQVMSCTLCECALSH